MRESEEKKKLEEDRAKHQILAKIIMVVNNKTRVCYLVLFSTLMGETNSFSQTGPLRRSFTKGKSLNHV